MMWSFQEQDSRDAGFDSKQSFVGVMSDYILSLCEIQSYMDELNFTAGNALNWSALELRVFDGVQIFSKSRKIFSALNAQGPEQSRSLQSWIL